MLFELKTINQMFLDNTNQEMGQNNEKFTDSLKIQVVFIIFKTYFKKISDIWNLEFRLIFRWKRYTHKYENDLKLWLCTHLSPLSFHLSWWSQHHRCVFIAKGAGRRKNNYYCLCNTLKAFIATLRGPLSILLLVWMLFGGTLAFVPDVSSPVQKRPKQFLYMQ